MKHAAALLLALALSTGARADDPAPAVATSPAPVATSAPTPAPTLAPTPAPAVPPTTAPAPTAVPAAKAPAAAVPTPTPATTGNSPAPFLWKVKVGDVTHYLLGSVHLLPKLAHPLPAALEDAYAKSDTVVFESDLGALDAPDMQRAVLAAARGQVDGLRSEIPAPMYQRVQEHARNYGLPDNVCDPYAAWFCAMTFEIFSLRQEGFDASLGLDQHFYERAADDNKAVAWFEAPAEHLKLFTAMTPEMAQSFLAATLDEDGDPDQQPSALLKAWQTGDIAYVDRLDTAMKQDYPALYERLLAARNRAWLPNLAARLKLPAAQMIIVGAAHLVGPDGLVSALRARGFDVQRVGAPETVVPPAPAKPEMPAITPPPSAPKPDVPAPSAAPASAPRG